MEDEEDALGLPPPTRGVGTKMRSADDLCLGFLGCYDLVEAVRHCPKPDARFASSLWENHTLIAFPDGRDGERDRAMLRRFLAANLGDLHAAALLLTKVAERGIRA